MGKKFIIELEDEPLVRNSALHGETAVFRAKGSKTLVFDDYGIEHILQPIEGHDKEIYNRGRKDEQDVNYEYVKMECENAYRRGYESAWSLIKKVVNMKPEEIKECFGDAYSIPHVLEMGYPNVVEKYEKWTHGKELQVGDEVTDGCTTGVVTSLFGGHVNVLGYDGEVYEDFQDPEKTGNYIDGFMDWFNMVRVPYEEDAHW